MITCDVTKQSPECRKRKVKPSTAFHLCEDDSVTKPGLDTTVVLVHHVEEEQEMEMD